ncbi:hypothetical protein BDP55DRAFT_686628 [Colletotrichum godetiae]|uniref:Uncharacterized protein n=1 Tax=Colletotrichum godetiae TaxID=1209918 RepID=A0AAJ0A605_9PEZI|nr:uncharacterized protein BDP55DRAFT_686628 [Colletotrichum godetiae]KAK1657144.1 hypothetical protein BDP55DRAFT_686628 [Colletotrichum godetiae]
MVGPSFSVIILTVIVVLYHVMLYHVRLCCLMLCSVILGPNASHSWFIRGLQRRRRYACLLGAQSSNACVLYLDFLRNQSLDIWCEEEIF